MNQRTKEFFIAVQDHIPIYGNTNMNAFVDGMKAIEPKFMVLETLKKHLEENDFTFFISSKGKVYEIYRYKNPNYKKG